MSQSSVRKLIAMVGVSPGAALFKERGCLACHRIGDVGTDVGPALEKVRSKYDREKLAQYIVNPQKVNPNSKMPEQPDVKPPEAEQIAEFLMGLK